VQHQRVRAAGRQEAEGVCCTAPCLHAPFEEEEEEEVVQEGDVELVNEEEEVGSGVGGGGGGGGSSRAAAANAVGRTRRSSPNIFLPVAALPGSNPRCGCAYGARQTSAIVAVARVGFVPHQQTTAEHALLANAAANFGFHRTSEPRTGARTSPPASWPLPVTIVAPDPSLRPAPR